MKELQFEIKKGDASINDELQNLYDLAQDPPVFYNLSMLKVFEKLADAEVFWALLRKKESIIIALPLMKQSYFSNVNYEGWDNLGPICSTTADKNEVKWFWNQLTKEVGFIKLSNVSQLILNQIESDIHGIAVSLKKCPYISLKNSWENQNEELSKKLVRNLRQYGNKADREGINIQIYFSNDLSTEEKIEKISQSYAFHNDRMDDKNQVSKFSEKDFQRYNEEVMVHASNVFIIEAKNAEEEIIACFYGLFNKTRLAYFNGGYNQLYNKLSIGTLLVKELVDYGISNGFTVFDFLRGNESYKSKWTNNYDLNLTIYMTQGGVNGIASLCAKFLKESRKRIGGKRTLEILFEYLTTRKGIVRVA